MDISIEEIQFNEGHVIYILSISLNQKYLVIKARRDYDSSKVKVLDEEYPRIHPYIIQFVKNHVASMNVSTFSGVD